MARTRDLKPSFFKNEFLAECHPLARILFQGLWTQADREGRLEDRPVRLKAEILPYDDCDIESLFSQLAKHKFITRYVALEKKIIQVNNFVDNQRIHPKEPDSVLPCLDAASRGKTASENALPSLPTIPSFPTLPSLPPAPKGGRQKKSLISDDWQPSEKFSLWLSENHPDKVVDLDYQIAKMKNNHKANGKKYADHEAALRNWFGSEYYKPSPQAASGKGQKQHWQMLICAGSFTRLDGTDRRSGSDFTYDTDTKELLHKYNGERLNPSDWKAIGGPVR
jgi:hypothetical protein